MGEIGNTNKGKGQSCPPAEGSGRTSGQINPGYGEARQGTYRLILTGVAQPQRGHIREKHKQPQANHQAAAQPPMNPPPPSSKEEIFQSTVPSGSTKRLPSLSTTSQGISEQLGEAPDAALPWAPQPQQLQLHLQFFRVKAKSWLFQGPSHLRISFAI